MNIWVCIKHVVDPEILIPREKAGGLELEGLIYRANECDRYAVQEAVRLKERYGGEVVTITVGPEHAVKTIYDEALARGADRAIHIICNLSFPEDPFMVASMIYGVIKNEKFDLIICGTQSDDNTTCITGGILAGLLNIPYVWGVRKIEDMKHGKLLLQREVASNEIEIVEVELPAVLAVHIGITELTPVSFTSLLAARKKQLKAIKPEDINININNFRVWNIKELYIPKYERKAIIIKGDIKTVAKEFLNILQKYI
jgi:electron transfer flavoprotein beta subunit